MPTGGSIIDVREGPVTLIEQELLAREEAINLHAACRNFHDKRSGRKPSGKLPKTPERQKNDKKITVKAA